MGNQSGAAKFEEYAVYWQQLDEFASDSSRECIRMTATLTSWQRFKVHERAHLLGLGHRTDDLADGSKIVMIWKLVDSAQTKYGPSQTFHGILSLGCHVEDNLRRTFDRYDFNQDKQLDREEVSTMVRDLFDLAIDDLEMKGDLTNTLAKKARRGLYRSLGRDATSKIVDALMACGTDGFLTFAEYMHAMKTNSLADLFDLADRLSNQQDTWRLAPLVDVYVDIDAMVNEDSWARVKLFACGCASGIASTCASGPLSRITVLMQTSTVAHGSEPIGLRAMFERVIARDGVRGIFRGTGLEALRAAPYSGINYFAYENYKLFLSQFDGTETKFASKFCAGGLGGVTGVLMTYPVDLLRTRVAIQKGVPGVSVLQHARLVFQSGGIFGFWSGAGAAAMTKFPSFCMLFSVCESSRDWLTHQGCNSFNAGLLSGACGSMVTNIVFFPMDTTIKILQAESAVPLAQRKYKGAIDVMRTIVREHGAAGLYRGIVPRICASMPTIMTNYATYSWLKSWLRL